MELNVKTRTITGKKVKHLRKEGFIPAEIFGHGIENRHISIDQKEFRSIYKRAGSHTVIRVITEEGKKIPVIISEVQHHPLTRKPLAVLLQSIRADEAIATKIPLEFIGTAPAEKSGFVVVKVLNEIEIEALPDKIPHSFKVDLSGLMEGGQSLHISELNVPPGVKILLPKDTVIATVTEREKEEVVPPAPAAAPAEALKGTETSFGEEAKPPTA